MSKAIHTKSILVCLLLAVFALPPVVREIHVLYEDGCTHSQHDCNHCVVCKFVVLPFIQPETTQYLPVAISSYRVVSMSEQPIHNVAYSFTRPRSPPR